MLINSLVFIVILLIGYILGRIHSTDIKVKETIKKFKNTFEKDRVGAVRRPTAESIRERGTPIKEAKDAMSESLYNDPYFNENHARRI